MDCSYCHREMDPRGSKTSLEWTDDHIMPAWMRHEGGNGQTVACWQPWASLIIIGAKPYEFRGRTYLAYINSMASEAPSMPARPVKTVEVKDLLFRIGDEKDMIVEPAVHQLNRVRAAYKCRALPLGAVLGTAVIGEPKRADEIVGRRPEVIDADYNWAWPLIDIEKFATPIHTRGMQGFWKWRP